MRTTRLTEVDYLGVMLEATADRSTCARRGVAAIALDQHRRIIGTGFNGVPRGAPHCIDTPCIGANDPSGNTSACLAIHAEQNMILNTPRTDDIVEVWASCTPCKTCAQLLVGLPNLRYYFCTEKYRDDIGLQILTNEMALIMIFGEDQFFVSGSGWRTISDHLPESPGSVRSILREFV